ncbi:MAG: XRE family transcriptional regulator [Sphingomonas adhaesiva]|uniref:XRE family transcriptional regulator n=1 Tax=Sphingomonas adhaesiva TaxID=28212 RepID=UPI002FFCE832
MAENISDPAREERLAEERLLYMAQTTIQRQLNRQGLKYRDLARKLEVSEARVSQLLGDDALNLTIRTLARVFHRLGEEVVLMPRRELDEMLDQVVVDTEQPAWTFAARGEEIYAGQEATEIVVEPGVRRGRTQDWIDWAAAEDAADRLRNAA